MKILEIIPHLVNTGPNPRSASGFGPNWTFVKITTDEGLTGWGEVFVTGRSETAQALVQEMGTLLVGQDSSRIRHLWNCIYRGARYPLGVDGLAALSGIELALWDLAGKRSGLPVHRLVGGRTREYVELYASGVYLNGAPELSEGMALAREHGFRCVKFNPHPKGGALSPGAWREALLKRVREVREMAGEEMDIALDYHGRDLSPARVVELLADLEPYRPLFVEEPALSNHIASLARVRRASRLPIAAGERCITRERVRTLLETEAVDYFQPEITACGGFAEALRFADWAELHHITVWPHHGGSMLALVIGAHLAASVSNFGMLECNIRLDHAVARELFAPWPQITDGRLSLPTGPGWGIEPDEAAMQRHPPRPFSRPSHEEADGAVGYQ
jgi:galactonate dehydratase